jgi:peptidoglycan/LPS O-acetylase OafA/YrhL
MEYNPRFDALRALCVLGVMAFHWQGILQFGWIGVQTFFVLSGFLITGILERSKERYRTLDYFFVFEWRRFLRICPAYFGYLGVLGFLFWITRQPDSLPQAAPYLSTFTLNIERLFPGYQNHQAYTHLWSLAVEFQFYLVWPVIVCQSKTTFAKHLPFHFAGTTAAFADSGIDVSHLRLPGSGGKCGLQFSDFPH